MSYLLMMPAFLCIVGVAMLYYCYTRFDGVESMVLSVITTIGTMFLSGKLFHNFTVGVVTMGVLGFAGIFAFCFGKLLKIAPKDKPRLRFFSPGFVLIFGALCYGIVAFSGEFIQNYDELQQWAAQVKYMFNYNEFPIIGSQFSGAQNMPYTFALFQLYFQKFTGYSEPNLYTSAFLLIWTGLALCVHNCRWKDWPRVLLFAAVIFVSLFSLYVYPYKCLYVDMPTAIWGGALCAWWSCERRGVRIKKAILPIAMLLCIALFKWLAGPLIAVLVMCFIAVQTICEKGIKYCARHYWGWVAAAVVGIIVFIFMFKSMVDNKTNAYVNIIDWESLKAIIGMKNEKVSVTFLAMMKALVSKPLSSVSSIQIYMLPLVIWTTAFLAIFRHFTSKEYFRSVALPQAISIPVGLVGYCIPLYICFIAIFPYTECVKISSISRYFAIYGVLIFTMMVATLVNNCADEEDVTDKEPENFKALRISASRIIACVLLVVFSFGINESFIWKASTLCSESVPLYSVVNTVREAAEDVKEIIGEEDRVYLIAQKSRNNSVSEAANYYMGRQVSGDREVPWQFTKEGAKIGLNLHPELSTAHISHYARAGKFTYVWIYNDNRFLEKEMKKYVAFDDYQQGGLYKISYNAAGGLKLGLVKVIKLKNYEVEPVV